MTALALLAWFLVSPCRASSNSSEPPQASTAVPKGERVLAQIRILGLQRIDETNVRAKLRAREWAPYSEQDRALDVATLLASGDFSSVNAREVQVSSTAFRLDIELVEASPVVAVEASTEPSLSTNTTQVLAPPPPAPIRWTPRPSRRAIVSGGAPNPPWVIGDLAITGNRHVKYNVIRSQLQVRRGELYERSDLDKDIQTLLGMGNFERVAADVVGLPDPVPTQMLDASGSTTTVKITFLVEEKPVVRKIRFEGYKKLSKGKLSDAITLKEKDPLDRVKLRDDEEKILETYRKKGYVNASVDARVALDTTSAMADVTYAVQEGSRTVIGSVEIEGVRAFKVKKILKQMKNRRKKIFDEKEFAEDHKKIETFYKNRGYVDFEIISSSISYNEDRTRIAIRLAVNEGHQHRFGQTRFKGHSVYAEKELRKQVAYKRGRIFNQEKLELTIRDIQDLYAEKGRLRTRVTPERAYNEATGQMDLVFHLLEGSVVYVDHVDIEGNKATKTHVLRREIIVKEGEPFAASRIRKSQEKIMNLGFIDDVQLDIQSPVDPDRADLTFEVLEGKPGMLTMGAGFSSLDGLIGTLSLQHMNLLGRAQRASVQWQFGARVQDYSLSWTTPWIASKPWSLGFDLFNTRRLRPLQSSFQGYVDKRLGGTVRLGPRFQNDKYLLGFSYTFMKVSVTNVESQFIGQLPEGTSIHSSVGVDLARDTRDNIWDPTRGTRHSIGFTLAGGPIFNGDIHFFSPTISNAAHFHLFSIEDYPFVLSLSNRAAYITPFGETKEVPVFNRFFLGGPDTLRGYAPTGEVGVPTGGKVYDVANVEFGFPIAREHRKSIVKLVTFFDAGTAWENLRSVRARIGTRDQDIKTDVGVGIRFVTPAFPIRLDWGYGLNHKPGERPYQINFGIGGLF